jgi:hypothetical protein
MAFDVGAFRAQLPGGGARPNLFRVTMNAPSFVGFPTEKMSFLCKTAELPGSTIGLVEVPYFGRSVKLAGDRTFPEWSPTIINDEDFLIRNAVEKWMDSIDSHTRAGTKRGAATSNPNSYVSDAFVEQFSKTGDVIKTYTFVNLFPTDLSPIEVSWESTDVIEEFTVTFNYDHWTSDTTS